MQFKRQQTLNPSQNQIDVLGNLYHSNQIIKVEKICRDLLQTYTQSFIVTNFLKINIQIHLEECINSGYKRYNLHKYFSYYEIFFN